MKCTSCGSNQKHKEGMTCTKCGNEFTLNPKTGPYLSDGAFQALLKSVSRNDTQYYTENQLFACFCRKKHRGFRLPLFSSIVLAGLAVIFVFVFPPVAMFCGFLAVVTFLAAMGNILQPINGRKEFPGAVKDWIKKRGKPEYMIVEPGLHSPPPDWNEPDIYDYGVERIIVVQRDILVDWFIHNKLHATEKALVISESGYPSYLVDVANRLLDESPELPVFLLHDSTLEGVELKSRLEHDQRLRVSGHPIKDLGLFPSDIAKMDGMKKLNTKRDRHHVPADYLMYGTIAGGIGLAMTEMTTLGALMESQARGHYSSDGGGDFG